MILVSEYIIIEAHSASSVFSFLSPCTPKNKKMFSVIHRLKSYNQQQGSLSMVLLCFHSRVTVDTFSSFPKTWFLLLFFNPLSLPSFPIFPSILRFLIMTIFNSGYYLQLGFTSGSDGKESACNPGDLG